MKNLYFLIAIITLSFNVSKSQSFVFTITPSNLTVIAGQTAEFEITITPINSFDGTILFRSDNQNINFKKNYINPPYNNFKFQITPSVIDSGLKLISISGQSGNIRFNSLCTLEVIKNPISEQYVEIIVPHNISSYSDKLIKDKENNLTILYTNTNQNFVKLLTYKDKVWDNKKLDIGLYFTDDIMITDFHFYRIINDSIWINHKNGLVLYYKNQVKIFNNKNSEIGDGEIKCVYLDNIGNPLVIRNRNNKYYLSYYKNGIWEKFNDMEFEFRYNIEDYDTYFKNLVSFDNENNIWFCDKNLNIYKIHFNNNIPVIEIQNFPDLEISKIYSDENGVLYLIDNTNLKINVLENNNINTINFPIDVNNINELVSVNSYNLWFRTENGLYNYLNNQFNFYSFKDFPVNNFQQLKKITLDKNNNVWVEAMPEGRFIVFNPNGLVGVPIISSVENEEIINNSLIFPNPSSDKISLDLGGVALADLVVYDILGNEIMSIPNYNSKSEIDISTIPIGTYTIQVQTDTGSIRQRFVKY